MSAYVSDDSETEHRRKRLRKGTHSCLECRRRKVRCIFQSNARRCGNCIDRDDPCTQQQDVGHERSRSSERRDSTGRRLQKVESLLGQILEKLPKKPTATLTPAESEQTGSEENLRKIIPDHRDPSTQTAASTFHPPSTQSNLTVTARDNDISSILKEALGNAPLLSLFNNSIISQALDQNHDSQSPTSPPCRDPLHGTTLGESNMRILKDLKTKVPNVHDLTLILQCSSDSRKLWHQVFPADLEISAAESENAEVRALRDFIYRSLNAEDVATVAKVVSCLSVHLQQLPRGYDFSGMNLPASSQNLQTYYMRIVERLLEPDDGLAATVGGIECMLLQAEFYINAGKPKKIWLIFRRAVNCGQLLRLHHHLDDLEFPSASRHWALWSQIWQTDRELSLVLGLPYAVSDTLIPFEMTESDRTEQGFLARLGIVTGRIIERNQSYHKMTYPITIQIDQELENCRCLMTQEWWETTADLHMSIEAIHIISVLKMKYHNVRKLLHLPFMLQSYTDMQYEGSRIACLESVREMIGCYQTLRDEKRPALKMCDMIDFQVFTAGMVILVDLLARSQSPTYHAPQKTTDDWETIHSLKEVFRRVSRTMVCSVAEQSAQLLEDFYNAYRGQDTPGETTYEAVIPFFGKLRIVRNHTMSSPPMVPPTATFGPDIHSDPGPVAFGPVVDPIISFDGYFPSLPGAYLPWQDFDPAWASNLGLGDEWSWWSHSENQMNDSN